ncbi:hypothetical protein LCGC14_2963750 [marine sediment metagenome]|uniref:Uncharacterized protein n=1 Tax=marine sediment metagenome TaxID=412755 RepID=A0A0F8XBG6_9ZZZZ
MGLAGRIDRGDQAEDRIMNKHISSAQRATEQLIRDAQVQLDGAIETNSWHRISDMEHYISGLKQAEVVYNHAIHKMKKEENELRELINSY